MSETVCDEPALARQSHRLELLARTSRYGTIAHVPSQNHAALVEYAATQLAGGMLAPLNDPDVALDALRLLERRKRTMNHRDAATIAKWWLDNDATAMMKPELLLQHLVHDRETLHAVCYVLLAKNTETPLPESLWEKVVTPTRVRNVSQLDYPFYDCGPLLNANNKQLLRGAAQVAGAVITDDDLTELRQIVEHLHLRTSQAYHASGAFSLMMQDSKGSAFSAIDHWPALLWHAMHQQSWPVVGRATEHLEEAKWAVREVRDAPKVVRLVRARAHGSLRELEIAARQIF